ncbi:MAG: type I-E CRISPR-associated protein Cas6/Cse3/CasE [Oscillospiraceae bacterium]|jgi:CRISPR system Cascade subunit CasE|nr:type I-E CRISPR-associated protein Cas6/Cse3/CasE [Oscillospiraceae bacterium]
MTYLSRVEININRRDTVRALSSPQILHAAIAGSFPATQESGRTLWRIDTIGNHTYILLLSSAKPDFTHVVEQFGWPTSEQQWGTKDYGVLLSRIAVGQTWRFRLCANPTHSERSSDGSRGRVYAHVTVEQQRKWLLDRAEKHGFALDPDKFDVMSSEQRQFRRGGGTVTIGTAVFEGLLRVTDADAFKSALVNGIGRAKAYGCGLITIERAL